MAKTSITQKIRCFTPRGRMRRAPFWLWNICVGAYYGLMTFIWLAYLYWLNNGVPAGSENMDAGLVWWLLVLIPGVVCSVFLLIQRVHDIGISGWWLLPIWIAVAVIGCVIPLWIPSTIGTLAIGFWPPQAKDNKFGPNSNANGAFIYRLPDDGKPDPSKAAA